MDPFSSPPPSGSGEGPSNEVVMDQVKQQLAQAYAEEFFGVRNNPPLSRFRVFCCMYMREQFPVVPRVSLLRPGFQ
jgi:hypothetical protein